MCRVYARACRTALKMHFQGFGQLHVERIAASENALAKAMKNSNETLFICDSKDIGW